ncbi:MAG: inositol monophosphatase family protein [Bacteroidales bacterium]
MNLELITKQVANLSRSVGSYVRNEIKRVEKTKIQHKGINDFVTYVDKTSEKKLVGELAKILPEAGFIAEENNRLTKKDRYNWVVDPLDGTTNFIHGIPIFSISIGLMFHDEIVSGVVFEPNQQECFYAWKDGGSYLNGQQILVSEAGSLNDSLIATGFPYSNYSRMEGFIETFTYLMKNTHGIRRLGSAALDLAYVACGRFDGFFEYGLHPWDTAAGSLLVEEAGGAVSGFEGKRNFIFGKEILASNKLIYKSFLEVITDRF